MTVIAEKDSERRTVSSKVVDTVAVGGREGDDARRAEVIVRTLDLSNIRSLRSAHACKYLPPLASSLFTLQSTTMSGRLASGE